jgi:hypothetical protein
VFVPLEADFFSLSRKLRPEVLFLRKPLLEPLGKLIGTAAKSNLAPKAPGPWRSLFLRRRLRGKLGGRLRCLFSEVPLPQELAAKTALLRLRTLAAMPETANFLL